MLQGEKPDPLMEWWENTVNAMGHHTKENPMVKFKVHDVVVDEDGDFGRIIAGPDEAGNYVYVVTQAVSKGAKEGEFYISCQDALTLYVEEPDYMDIALAIKRAYEGFLSGRYSRDGMIELLAYHVRRMS